MQFAAPIPFHEAIDKLGSRSPIGSLLKSADWRSVPVDLRERAFFSSTVENVRFLDRAQTFLTDFLTGARDTNAGGALKAGSRAQFINDLRKFAVAEGMGPLDPEDEGTLRDITSAGRLGLIFDTNLKAAQDFGYWKQGQDPDVLDAFPTQRFIRVRQVRKPRPYHEAHRNEVHRKDDLDFWLSMNPDFNVPWGPWGFNSGMDVEDVGRREAEQDGLIEKNESISPIDKGFNDRLQASTQGLSQALINLLQLAFEDQVTFDGDMVKWTPQDDDGND